MPNLKTEALVITRLQFLKLLTVVSGSVGFCPHSEVYGDLQTPSVIKANGRIFKRKSSSLSCSNPAKSAEHLLGWRKVVLNRNRLLWNSNFNWWEAMKPDRHVQIKILIL